MRRSSTKRPAAHEEPPPGSQELALPAGMQQRMQQSYRSSRQTLEASHKVMMDLLEQGTEKERHDFQKASEALQRKQSEVLTSQEAQTHHKRVQKSHQEMEAVEQQLADLQRKALRKSQGKNEPEAQKQALWEKVERGVEQVLYSDNEIQALHTFKNEIKKALSGGGKQVLLR